MAKILEAPQRIIDALTKVVQLDFPDMTLDEYLSRRFGVEIHVAATD